MSLCLKREALEEVVNFIWSIPRGVHVESYGANNTFLFQFASIEDRQRVWSGGPWQFDRQLISLVISIMYQ